MYIGTHIMWQLQAAIHCTRGRLRPGEWDLSNREGRSTDRHAGGRKQRKNNNKYIPKVFLIIFHRAHGTRFSPASVGRRVGAAIARSRALRPVYNRVFCVFLLLLILPSSLFTFRFPAATFIIPFTACCDRYFKSYFKFVVGVHVYYTVVEHFEHCS